ncbi:hypothetical protein [Pseudomonas sp. MWU12-2037]|uniref:hypothetical protein n=1 Tax=Pseudomonas sp. MWU12-2037 TaxID=2928690 RepID=UPI00200D0800|nr:hypothetical protein [Pseudomonas sp. MWU12-2037]
MKAILFAVVTTLTASVSAADLIYVNTELARNGETVDNFVAVTANGFTQPHRNVQLIKYRKSVANGKVEIADLEVGTTASITPVITSGGSIRLRFDVSYVRLMKMDTAKVGNTYIDLPRTEGFKFSSTDVVPNGERREYRSSQDGVEYIYTVAATKR